MPPAVLIAGGIVLEPRELGVRDILIAGGIILAMEPKIDQRAVETLFPDIRILDVSGLLVTPGLIDQHNHFNGAGGEGGPAFRTPPAQLSSFVRAGITGAVGLLGTDGFSRSLTELLAKARGLEVEGLSTWIYTGSYQIPSPTITGSVGRDLTVIDKVIGVKIALSDHRSPHPTTDELRRLISDVRVAGLLSGKPGVVCIHMGSEPSMLEPLREALSGLDIPWRHLLPTHVSRTKELLADAIRLVKDGGYADITADKKTPAAIESFVRAGADMERVTLSSDGNGSMPRFSERGEFLGMGIGSPDSLLRAIRTTLEAKIVSRETAFSMVTANVAKQLGLNGKGHIAPGYHADLAVLSPELELYHLIGKGQFMMKNKKILRRGTFEI
ncbi:MAG: beta-aspartyl-peptidase [Dethiosulfovibrio peptidovorans]|nr:MAG: beta-aspartyl-peptidase [Dethiosulfovibrio peptidovorans]